MEPALVSIHVPEASNNSAVEATPVIADIGEPGPILLSTDLFDGGEEEQGMWPSSDQQLNYRKLGRVLLSEAQRAPLSPHFGTFGDEKMVKFETEVDALCSQSEELRGMETEFISELNEKDLSQTAEELREMFKKGAHKPPPPPKHQISPTSETSAVSVPNFCADKLARLEGLDEKRQK